METGQTGKNLIKSFEQLRLKAYQDSVGIWTIGWGHTHQVVPNMEIDDDTAIRLLNEDLEITERCVNSYVQVQLTQKEFDAVVCFTFNVGCNAFKNSTMCKLINEEKYEEAAKEFPRWNKARGKILGGLIRRRKAEMELFLA